MINTTSTLPAATWRDYLTLTKPKVISLLLFTAVCPMFMAARGLPPWLPLLGVLVGGYMATGGAGVFNMVLDRDIDGKMRRTANRPLVTGVVTVRNAVIFGFLLSIGAFLILWLTANLLTALLAWFGLLFYVIVYTAWLKRSTWQNIVIGGVAGSVMPLLGWAAVTNGLDWMAGLLFVLIFMWTPVHFWALAFLVKDQYEAVGIPMAPAILGSKGTLQQMLIYAALTTLASLAPLALNEAGWLYTGVVLLLDFLLISKVVKLYRQVDVGQEVNRKEALSLQILHAVSGPAIPEPRCRSKSDIHNSHLTTQSQPIRDPERSKRRCSLTPHSSSLSPRLQAPTGRIGPFLARFSCPTTMICGDFKWCSSWPLVSFVDQKRCSSRPFADKKKLPLPLQFSAALRDLCGQRCCRCRSSWPLVSFVDK